MKTGLIFALLVTAIAASLWLPNLFTYGMFMDGVINASVAKLYAEGTGTFFSMQERYYANGTYVGHPPLVFVIQGAFFKLFGTAYYMDKLYSMLCAIGQLLLMASVWKAALAGKKLKPYAWLPCLLWLLSPIISWGYSSNLLENTMSLFTTAALAIILNYVHKGRQLILAALITTLFMFAGLLCKGPVALFILAAPMVLAEVNSNYTFKKALGFSTVMIIALVLLIAATLQLPEAQQFLAAYYKAQLSPSVSTEGASIFTRLQLLPNLLRALLPILIVAALVLIGKRWLPIKDDKQERTMGARLLILGLCASLPVMLSNKQSAFYVIPAMPVLALGLALFIAVPMRMLCEKYVVGKLRSTIAVLSLFGIVIMLVLSLYNASNCIRDVDMLRDLAQVNKLMGAETKLLDPQNEFAEEYQLKAYLNRLYGKTIYTQGSHTWIIIKKDSSPSGLGESAYKGKTIHLLYNAW